MEVWERFSFYGMQAILTIYLYYEISRGGLGLPEESAASIVGAYGAALTAMLRRLMKGVH